MLPKAFVDNTYSVSMTGRTTATNTASVRTYSIPTQTTTSFTTAGLSISIDVMYIAIGKWK